MVEAFLCLSVRLFVCLSLSVSLSLCVCLCLYVCLSLCLDKFYYFNLYLTYIIYVSNPDKLIRTHVPTTSMSDHYLVCCTLSCQIPKASICVTYRFYKHFDPGAFFFDLSNSSFDAMYGLTDPDESLAYSINCSY